MKLSLELFWKCKKIVPQKHHGAIFVWKVACPNNRTTTMHSNMIFWGLITSMAKQIFFPVLYWQEHSFCRWSESHSNFGIGDTDTIILYIFYNQVIHSFDCLLYMRTNFIFCHNPPVIHCSCNNLPPPDPYISIHCNNMKVSRWWKYQKHLTLIQITQKGSSCHGLGLGRHHNC